MDYRLTTQQQQAFNKFKQLKVGALFMQQGTGKTRVAIELIESTDSTLAIFFCPFSTKENLEAELKKWNLSTDYRIIGYESLSASDRIYTELYELLDQHEGDIFMVADESIFIKNEETRRFSRLMRLANFSTYRLLLNGTPITQNEWDIYNQMHFLSPKIIGMNRPQFLSTFFTKIAYKKRGQSPKEFYKFSEVNAQYLYKLIEPYIFKVDLNFDKEISTNYQLIYASDQTIGKYLTLKDELLEKIAQQEDFLDILATMRYVLFTDKERCKMIAQKLNGQIIVYCSFIAEVEQIAQHLDCYIIIGDTPAAERQHIIDQFKQDNKPLLMTFGVGAYGLNLQFCNHIAFASLTFDYGHIDQAKHRIQRLGQTRDITYTYFTSDVGLYNVIEQNIIKKEMLSDLLIKEVMMNETIQRSERT